MDTKQLEIPPLQVSGKAEMVPVSKIKPGHKNIVNWPDAMVAFLDVLGFSRKRSGKDIELTLADFSGPY